MTHYYLDSSALVKLYAAETGTAWVTALCAPAAGHIVNIVRITGAEIIAALFRRVQIGSLTPPDAQVAAARFRRDLSSRYEIIEVTEALVDVAMRLAETPAHCAAMIPFNWPPRSNCNRYEPPSLCRRSPSSRLTSGSTPSPQPKG